MAPMLFTRTGGGAVSAFARCEQLGRSCGSVRPSGTAPEPVALRFELKRFERVSVDDYRAGPPCSETSVEHI